MNCLIDESLVGSPRLTVIKTEMSDCVVRGVGRLCEVSDCVVCRVVCVWQCGIRRASNRVMFAGVVSLCTVFAPLP